MRDMELRNELFRPVVGHEDKYEISNFGTLRRFSRKAASSKRVMMIKEKILKPTVNNIGYQVVNLKSAGKSTYRLIHRLVADAWIENPTNKECVNHKNGIRTDNRAENLEWVNKRENYAHWAITNKKKSSKYIGVYKSERGWTATIRLGKVRRLGTFKTEQEARFCYISALKANNLENKYAL